MASSARDIQYLINQVEQYHEQVQSTFGALSTRIAALEQQIGDLSKHGRDRERRLSWLSNSVMVLVVAIVAFIGGYML